MNGATALGVAAALTALALRKSWSRPRLRRRIVPPAAPIAASLLAVVLGVSHLTSGIVLALGLCLAATAELNEQSSRLGVPRVRVVLASVSLIIAAIALISARPDPPAGWLPGPLGGRAAQGALWVGAMAVVGAVQLAVSSLDEERRQGGAVLDQIGAAASGLAAIAAALYLAAGRDPMGWAPAVAAGLLAARVATSPRAAAAEAATATTQRSDVGPGGPGGAGSMASSALAWMVALAATLPGVAQADRRGLALLGFYSVLGGISAVVVVYARRTMAPGNRDYQRRLARLEHDANHDQLTGLANRARLYELVDGGADDDIRRRAGQALLFVDLDGFKAVNDNHGHPAGDAVLVEVASRLKSLVRPDDVVARLGGDEFVVALLSLPQGPADARHTGDRLLEAVRQPVTFGGALLGVGASVGIAFPAPGERCVDVLKRADQSMYSAKRAGKGQVVVFGEEKSIFKPARPPLPKRPNR